MGRVRTELSGLETPMTDRTSVSPPCIRERKLLPEPLAHCCCCCHRAPGLAEFWWLQLVWALILVIGGQPWPSPVMAMWPVVSVFWLGNRGVKQGCTSIMFFMKYGNETRIWERSSRLWLICCIWAQIASEWNLVSFYIFKLICFLLFSENTFGCVLRSSKGSSAM